MVVRQAVLIAVSICLRGELRWPHAVPVSSPIPPQRLLQLLLHLLAQVRGFQHFDLAAERQQPALERQVVLDGGADLDLVGAFDRPPGLVFRDAGFAQVFGGGGVEKGAHADLAAGVDGEVAGGVAGHRESAWLVARLGRDGGVAHAVQGELERFWVPGHLGHEVVHGVAHEQAERMDRALCRGLAADRSVHRGQDHPAGKGALGIGDDLRIECRRQQREGQRRERNARVPVLPDGGLDFAFGRVEQRVEFFDDRLGQQRVHVLLGQCKGQTLRNGQARQEGEGGGLHPAPAEGLAGGVDDDRELDRQLLQVAVDGAPRGLEAEAVDRGSQGGDGDGPRPSGDQAEDRPLAFKGCGWVDVHGVFLEKIGSGRNFPESCRSVTRCVCTMVAIPTCHGPP
jgi:hypothetical protein